MSRPGAKLVDADRLSLFPHFLEVTHSLDGVEVDGLTLRPAALRPILAIERILVAQSVTRRYQCALCFRRNRVAKLARAALGVDTGERPPGRGCDSRRFGGNIGGGISGS